MTLTLEELENHWKVTVADDGLGFDPEAVKERGSIGMENVRQRMSRFPNSALEITSSPGMGTRVVLYGKQGENLEKI